MASWVIARSCTQCGQPQSTCPSRSSSRSAASGFGSATTSPSAMISSRERDRADQRSELVVGDAEALAVAVLEHDVRPQVGVDALEVRRMQRQPPLVGLARRGEHAESEE